MYSEAHVGELLPSAKEAEAAARNRGQTPGKKSLPDSLGDNKNRRSKAATRARTIAANPEVIEEVIKEAEAEGDVPTKGAVLRKVKKARESPGPALRYL